MEPCVVIVSPYFPPATVAGVHRARHLAKHFPTHGLRPIVIRADPMTYAEIPDPDLERLVPDSIDQIYTKALPIWMTRRIGIGDLGLRALPYLAGAVDTAMTHNRVVGVLLTGAPFYPLLLSALIKRRYKAPVVVDLQDPWVSAFGAQQPLLSKAGAANAVARILEPIALRSADAVTSVSEVQNLQLRARYPFLSQTPMEAIPIGGDPDDFAALRKTVLGSRLVTLDPAKINLNYVGTLLPRAAPLVRVLFKALRSLVSGSPQVASRIRLNFIGTSNQAANIKHAPVTELAAEWGVADFVFEVPRRVPFLEALSLLAQADGLLMIGSDEPHYTASKIYPNLMARRPFFSLFHAASSSHAILRAAGGGIPLSFSTHEELNGLAGEIEHALATLASNPAALGIASPEVYAAFTAEAIAGRYRDLFCSLQNEPSAASSPWRPDTAAGAVS